MIDLDELRAPGLAADTGLEVIRGHRPADADAAQTFLVGDALLGRG